MTRDKKSRAKDQEQQPTKPPTIHTQYYLSISDPEDTTIANVSVVPRHNTMFISNLWVHGKHRREGLGKLLFGQAVADYGWRRLYLHVASYTDRAFDDPELTKWYATFGFREGGAPGTLVRPPCVAIPPPWLSSLSEEDLTSLEDAIAAVRAGRGEGGHV